MKHTFIILSLFLLPAVSSAQKTGFSIGGEAGVNTARINGMKVRISHGLGTIREAELSNKTGQTAGLFGQFHFNTYFALQTGFYYEGKGQDYRYFVPFDPMIPQGSNRYVYASHSIDTRVVPLLFRAQYGGKRVKGFVNIGGYAAYIKSFYTFQTDPKSSFTRDYMLEDDWFKRYEYGVSGGIGISYTLKEKVSFSFEVRTNQGMSDIKDKLDDPNSKFLKLNTVNFLFGVTQHFNLKKKTSTI